MKGWLPCCRVFNSFIVVIVMEGAHTEKSINAKELVELTSSNA
jgi:hypothetical protein